SRFVRDGRRREGSRSSVIGYRLSGKPEHRTPITEHRLSRVEYVFERIQRPVVLADLVMEVRPGGAAGRSDETDTLAAPDALPLVDEDRVHVSIDRRVTGGMRDCDRLAVIA